MNVGTFVVGYEAFGDIQLASPANSKFLYKFARGAFARVNELGKSWRCDRRGRRGRSLHVWTSWRCACTCMAIGSATIIRPRASHSGPISKQEKEGP